MIAQQWEADGTCVYFGDGGIDLRRFPDAQARAMLIAAAPDLLEQLQRVMDALGGECFDWAPVRNAIAKATGSTA